MCRLPGQKNRLNSGVFHTRREKNRIFTGFFAAIALAFP
jgi:hypothetical protein